MKKLLLVLAIVGIVAAPGLATAQQLFDFNGQALVPAAIGDPVNGYVRVDDAGVIPTPIPLDFDNFEYTIVVSAPLAAQSGGTQDYGPGTITLYEDAATPADYTNLPTFSDGTAILSGTFFDFSKTMFTSTLGSGAATVDWTGGTRLGEIDPVQQTGWVFVVSVSTRSTVLEPGFDENWDGKVEPLAGVSNGESSISEMKARH